MFVLFDLLKSLIARPPTESLKEKEKETERKVKKPSTQWDVNPRPLDNDACAPLLRHCCCLQATLNLLA